MRESFLPFSRPSITESEIAAVAGVLRSGWITTGARCSEFEAAFSRTTGAAHSVAVTSGTTALRLCLRAIGIGPGDEVVTPAMTWVSTPNLVVLAGATPVFVDVDGETLLVRPEAVEAAITERTRAIIPVHFAGAPADLAPLRALAAARGIPLIEDAAHALGTTCRGEAIGSKGTAIFSFHPIKNITTGEGGMMSTDDAALAERVRRLRFHGLGVDAFDRETQGRKPQAEVLEPGYKANLTDIAAVLGLGQLARLPEMNRRRATLAERYLDLFRDVEEVRPLARPDFPHDHSWHLFVVRLLPEKAGLSRDEFMAALKRENIGTGLHFRAAHLHAWYRQHPAAWRGDLPATEWNSERILSLPLFPDMSEEEPREVVEAIRRVLSKRGGRR